VDQMELESQKTSLSAELEDRLKSLGDLFKLLTQINNNNEPQLDCVLRWRECREPFCRQFILFQRIHKVANFKFTLQ